jgi:hypothetical protein
VVQLLETLVGWASCAPKAAIQINTPEGRDGQKPGFFCDNISLETAETAKNPVSLVLMRKSQARKS